MENPINRRDGLKMAGGVLVGSVLSLPALAADPNKALAPLDKALASLVDLVHPALNWSDVELNAFLAKLPPSALLSMKKATGWAKEDAKEAELRGAEEDVKDIKTGIYRNYYSSFRPGDEEELPYHEMVQWVANKVGVDPWFVKTQHTFVLERAVCEKVFADVWDTLSQRQRSELLNKIDLFHGNNNAIRNKAAIASLSGAAAIAALATTVHFTGFAFYTTMSVTICTVAGFFGVTLPFAVFANAAMLVSFLSGPVGWALVAAAVAAGYALLAAGSLKETAATIMQIHMLKVAALEAAGKSDPKLFEPLGDPLKRFLLGKWRYSTDAGFVQFHLKSDWTYESKLFRGFGDDAVEIESGEGVWSVTVASKVLTVTQKRSIGSTANKVVNVHWIDSQAVAPETSGLKATLANGKTLQRW